MFLLIGCGDDAALPVFDGGPQSDGGAMRDAAAAQDVLSPDTGVMDSGVIADAGVDAGNDSGRCEDACRENSDPVCEEDSLFECRDDNADGCFEYVVAERCEAVCSAGACVECRDAEDCGDPLRMYCAPERTCESRPGWALVSGSGLASATGNYRLNSGMAFGDQFELHFIKRGADGAYNGFHVDVDSGAGLGLGTHSFDDGVDVRWLLQTADVPASFRALYGSEAVGSEGTVTFTMYDVRPGGVVAGTVQGTLASFTDGQTIPVDVEFHSTL